MNIIVGRCQPGMPGALTNLFELSNLGVDHIYYQNLYCDILSDVNFMGQMKKVLYKFL